jgi:regulatory protein
MTDAVTDDRHADALALAVRLLAARDHSRRELRRKLARRISEEDLVDQVLADLERQGLISDRRFAETYVDQRCRKGFGPLRIRAELAERGIDSGVAAACLDVDDAVWRDLLVDVARRKFGTDPVTDRREAARQGRFLEQRGFPVGLIRRYLSR